MSRTSVSYRRPFASAAVAILSVVALGPGPAAAESLAHTLVGGEWTCASTGTSGASQSERLAYFPDGTWRSTLNAESVTADGDRIWSEARLEGTYTIVGNKFQATVTAAHQRKITRNGQEVVLNDSDKQTIEQRFMRPRPQMTVESWDAGRSVWTNGSQRFICTRKPAKEATS